MHEQVRDHSTFVFSTLTIVEFNFAMANCGTVCQYKSSIQGLLIGALTILFTAWIVQVISNWRRKRTRVLNLAAKLPGPKPLPLIGNALQFACKPEELLKRTVEAIIPYDDVTPMRFWLGPFLHVVVTEPRDIEILLNSQNSTQKGLVYCLLRPFIGDGLISGSGPTWRSHRKLFAPMLNGRTLESYVNSLGKHTQVFLKKLKPLANGSEFDIGPYLTRFTIDVMCETIMGCRDINAQDNPDQQFIHSTEQMYEIVHNRMMKVWLHPDYIFRLSSGYREQKKCQQIIHGFTEKLIATKKQEFAASSKSETADNLQEEKNSILEKLIRKIQQDQLTLSDEELRDELYTIYLASQDTLALIGNFTLLMLGIHKDIQEKVRSELVEILGTENVVTDSLPDLKYLEMVIKETLRLFPVAPFLGRTLQSDLALETCVLPEGCEVIIANYVTQRSPRHWKNPEKFLPERFTAKEIAKRHPYAYNPFSGGLMGCIGQKFAMMSLKTIIANVVRSYRINSTIRMEDIRLKSDISIRCIDGFKVSLDPC